MNSSVIIVCFVLTIVFCIIFFLFVLPIILSHKEKIKKKFYVETEIMVKDALTLCAEHNWKEYSEKVKNNYVLALRIRSCFDNEVLGDLFLDCFECYIKSNKIAFFPNFIITNNCLLFYKEYQGVGIYSGTTCPVITDIVFWDEIINISVINSSGRVRIYTANRRLTVSNNYGAYRDLRAYWNYFRNNKTDVEREILKPWMVGEWDKAYSLYTREIFEPDKFTNSAVKAILKGEENDKR